MKLKKGDTVIVLSGKDKGKTGKIERVFPQKAKVQVEGINQFKKHVKARSANEKSEIVVITKALNVSKVALVDPKTKKATRIGYKITKGEKTRVAKKSGEKI